MNNEVYITIAETCYLTTKQTIKDICLNCGYDNVVFQTENLKGRFRKGYYQVTFKHSFRSFADKLRASQKVKEALNKLEVV